MWHRITSSLASNIFFLILVSFLLWNAVRIGQEALALRKEKISLEAGFADIAQEKSVLEARLAELDTREAVEREAKTRFNLKLPGEEVVVVIPPEKRKLPIEESQSLWSKILRFFQTR